MAKTEPRAGIRRAALSLGVFVSAVLAGPVAAGEEAFYFDQDGPVIVDRETDPSPGLSRQVRARPVPRSATTTTTIAQVGNLRVERSRPIPCGDRTSQRLVLCLDADDRFPPDDELTLLARAPRVTAVEVGSVRARDALTAALSLAQLTLPVEPVVTAFADCTGSCAGRVVVENAP